MKEKDLIIIGGGPAGLTAGIYGKRAELDLIILESGAGGGQIATAGLVENYPGFPDGIRGIELAETFKGHAKKAGVSLNILEPVEDIKKEGRFFFVKTTKEKYKARSVIVATGLVHKKLGVPGEERLSGRGVSYCATCDGAFFKGKDVAVVGSGTGAVMAALNLADLASQIFLISKKGSLKVAERIMETRLKKTKNIKVISNTTVSEIIGENKVNSLQIVSDGKESRLVVDGVFIEVGKTPQTSFLKSVLGDLKKGFVVVDSNQMTGVSGLFAAGDVVYGSVKQLGVAVAHGTVAALSAYDYIKNNF